MAMGRFMESLKGGGGRGGRMVSCNIQRYKKGREYSENNGFSTYLGLRKSTGWNIKVLVENVFSKN